MRRTDVKPKERRKVLIPEELRESMRGVYEYILEAERNGDLSTDFDDAIQVDRVCGGRVGTKARPYVFTFYPSSDKQSGLWHLTLHPTEIEDIRDGVLSEIAMYCCASPECRRKFREADDTCELCDYEDEAKWLQKKLNELAISASTKEEWAKAYFSLKPDASGLTLMRDYNSIAIIVDRLGSLTASEAKELLMQRAPTQPTTGPTTR